MCSLSNTNNFLFAFAAGLDQFLWQTIETKVVPSNKEVIPFHQATWIVQHYQGGFGLEEMETKIKREDPNLLSSGVVHQKALEERRDR